MDLSVATQVGRSLSLRSVVSMRSPWVLRLPSHTWSMVLPNRSKQIHRVPNHNSKMVLSIVHFGPAGAGLILHRDSAMHRGAVHPRVGGGTVIPPGESRFFPGLSPRGRGNLREATAGNWSFGFETPLTACGFVGLKPDTEYEVEIRSKNASGESEPSLAKVRTSPEGGLAV